MKLFKKLKSKYIELGSGNGGQRSEVGVQTLLVTRHSSLQNRIAVLGDIHANLEALTFILADAKAQEVSQFICTGDIVGYGANPSECLKIIRDMDCPVVRGNHDVYAASDESLNEFSLMAMNSLIWTREHLSEEDRAWLGALPMEMDIPIINDMEKDLEGTGSVPPSPDNNQPSTINSFHLVHSSIFEPEQWHYIIKQEEAEKILPLQQTKLVFFGHTHIPSLYTFNTKTDNFESQVPLLEGIVELKSDSKYLINPGSVGQPRDRDPRASYALYNPEAHTLEIRRVEYDIAATQAKIEAARLPLRNAERLSKGR